MKSRGNFYVCHKFSLSNKINEVNSLYQLNVKIDKFDLKIAEAPDQIQRIEICGYSAPFLYQIFGTIAAFNCTSERFTELCLFQASSFNRALSIILLTHYFKTKNKKLFIYSLVYYEMKSTCSCHLRLQSVSNLPERNQGRLIACFIV